MSLSYHAASLWFAHFLNPKSTLRFGGDGATMAITSAGRKALDELIEIGAVETIEPNDQIPNREHYGSTGMDLRQDLAEIGFSPFEVPTDKDFVIFRKKETIEEAAPVKLMFEHDEPTQP